MIESGIDWSKQHCGIHQAPIVQLEHLMPDVYPMIRKTFPDHTEDFTWDIKVHMLMPNQYPCIPNWHCDFVPRINGIQRFDLITPQYPMYVWISGAPLTQFKHGFLTAGVWHRFTQLDEHRGTSASEFTWRAFIRATHQMIQQPKTSGWIRRHCQVYLDATTYQW